jgi:hypothetical protein
MDSVTLFINAVLDGVLVKDAANSPGSTGQGLRRTFGAYSKSGTTLGASTFPALTKPPVDLSFELVDTEHDFDLTAAPAAEDVDLEIDLTGTRLVAILIYAPADNVDDVTLGPHPTLNGYEAFGTEPETIRPDECLLRVFLDTADDEFEPGTPDVAADAKVLRLAGTAGDSIECIAYFGT